MSGSAAAAESPRPGAAAPSPPRRERGQRLVVRCERMVHGGVCLARPDDGGTLLVDGAIPGERCEVEVSARRGGAWFASVVEVLEPSPHRVAAPCPYFGACGGCQLQHVAYPHQLELKRGIVEDALRRAHVPPPDRIAVHGMPDPWSYRWRGELHAVRERDGVTALGFKRLHSWTPVAVDDCLIHHTSIRRSLPLLRDLAASARRGLGTLHVTVGEGGDELLVRGRPDRALPPAALDAASAAAPVRLAAEGTTLRWRERVFRVMPESFIQVNWTQMDTLYGLVLDALGDTAGTTVIDAYAGIGVLSVAIAERAARVVCIEANHVAAQLGVLNAEMNGCGARVGYVAEPVEESLAAVAAGAGAVVVDPPRAGCDSRVTGWLAFAGPPLLVYVSCDPATLARDLRILVGAGPYRLERLDAVDMFAQTWHVECVAVLRRAPEGA